MVTPASPIEAVKPFRRARGVRAQGPFLPRNAAGASNRPPLRRSAIPWRRLVTYLAGDCQRHKPQESALAFRSRKLNAHLACANSLLDSTQAAKGRLPAPVRPNSLDLRLCVILAGLARGRLLSRRRFDRYPASPALRSPSPPRGTTEPIAAWSSC